MELMILQNTKNQIITYSFQIHSDCDEIRITGMTTMIGMYTHKKKIEKPFVLFIYCGLSVFVFCTVVIKCNEVVYIAVLQIHG